MSATCDEDADTVSVACDPGWIDLNDEQSDGCEVGYDAIPATNDMAQAAAVHLFGGSRSVTLEPDCAAEGVLGCVNGEPADPASVLQLTGVSLSGIKPLGVNRFDITAEVTMKSLHSIPFRIAGSNCLVDIDTAAIGSPTIVIALSLAMTNLEDPTDPANRLVPNGLTVSGFDDDDYHLSGDFLCSLGSILPSGMLADMVEAALEAWIGPGLCGAPEPELFIPCAPSP